MTPQEALREAISRAKSQTALASMIGGDIKTGHIFHWLKAGVPARYAPAIERATGVRCEDLCPGVEWEVLRLQVAPQEEAQAGQGA